MCNSPLGLYYNFADCGDQGSPYGDNILAWFAAKSGNGNYFERDKFLSPSGTMRLDRFSGAALAWMSQYKEISKAEVPNVWFGKGSNPIAIFKSPATERGYYLGAKGGHGSLNHGNMDAGSFIFELDGVRWVVDPGVQPYHELEKTGFDLWGNCQDCERWKLLTKNNFGHSTLTVNNELHVVDGHAEMIHYKASEMPEVSFDLSATFAGQLNGALGRFVNTGPASIVIEDRLITSEETKSITWQLITVADVEIVGSGAILRQDGKQLLMNNLSHPNSKLSVISLDPPPFELDKRIENLKRIEIAIPVPDIAGKELEIRLELKGIDAEHQNP